MCARSHLGSVREASLQRCAAAQNQRADPSKIEDLANNDFCDSADVVSAELDSTRSSSPAAARPKR